MKRTHECGWCLQSFTPDAAEPESEFCSPVCEDESAEAVEFMWSEEAA